MNERVQALFRAVNQAIDAKHPGLRYWLDYRCNQRAQGVLGVAVHYCTTPPDGLMNTVAEAVQSLGEFVPGCHAATKQNQRGEHVFAIVFPSDISAPTRAWGAAVKPDTKPPKQTSSGPSAKRSS